MRPNEILDWYLNARYWLGRPLRKEELLTLRGPSVEDIRNSYGSWTKLKEKAERMANKQTVLPKSETSFGLDLEKAVALGQLIGHDELFERVEEAYAEVVIEGDSNISAIDTLPRGHGLYIQGMSFRKDGKNAESESIELDDDDIEEIDSYGLRNR